MPANPIDSTTLSDIRQDTGFDGSVFSHVQISRCWDRMAAAVDTQTQYNATIALMFFQMLNNAVKLHDYQIGTSRQSLNQVYNHFKERYEDFKPALTSVTGIKPTLAIVSLKVPMHPEQMTPSDSFVWESEFNLWLPL